MALILKIFSHQMSHVRFSHNFAIFILFKYRFNEVLLTEQIFCFWERNYLVVKIIRVNRINSPWNIIFSLRWIFCDEGKYFQTFKPRCKSLIEDRFSMVDYCLNEWDFLACKDWAQWYKRKVVSNPCSKSVEGCISPVYG